MLRVYKDIEMMGYVIACISGVGKGGWACVAQETQEFESREDTWDLRAFVLFGSESGILLSEVSER